MIIIKAHNDDALCREVNRILIEAGVQWQYSGRIDTNLTTGAYRIDGRVGAVANRAGNPHFYDDGYEQYRHLDARTQMDQVRAFFGVAEPAPAQTVAPNWERIVVVFDNSVELQNQLKQHCVRLGYYSSFPNARNSIGTIALNRTGYIGFNDVDSAEPSWWNESHDGNRNFHILQAATEMDQILAWLERNSPNKPEIKQMDKEQQPPADEPGKKKQPPTKFVIRIDDQNHGVAIQELAFAAGYFISPTNRTTRLLHGQFKQFLALGAYDQYGPDIDRRNIVQDSRRSTFHSAARTYYSTTDMEAIKSALNAVRDWALEAAKNRPAAEFVNPNLLSLIKETPKAEMVRGFIRKEFKLKLPESVQNEGADAILKYLSENVKVVLDWPKPEPPKDESIEVEFEVREGMRSYTVRDDTVRLKAKVPANIVQRAKDEGDPYVITRWLEEQTTWASLPVVRRVEGEAEPDGNGFRHYSYHDFTDEDALASEISAKLEL